MSVSALSFAVFAASQVGTPGPANMALLATGAAHGLRRALPFVGGVVLGKQLIIWPIGFGLMGVAAQVPWLFAALKWASAAYICWLAWRVAGMKLQPGDAAGDAPGFAAGLAVHPLNPKAWAMIATGFTSFTAPGTPLLQATATVAVILLAMQLLLHPVWAGAGQLIARTVAGTRAERTLMVTLALLTVASVFYAIWGTS
ncbi:LysE family translocator [Maribius pontilimi]|uniref:LysE family translocator n=1 Tax=Palleronia pontilimi TaxID=1964209 RepID=A0A934IGU5_9RHOB|nr:LysE family translocator [Palleronia pontilimi]MBJ3762852.1 LysE family translocator [Palleronia pontilimi]